MTKPEFAAGMAKLAIAFNFAVTAERSAARAEVYFERVHFLTAAAWAFAVDRAIESLHHFPNVADLLEFAREAPGTLPAFVPSLLTPDEREARREGDREVARRGVEMVRQSLASVGIVIQPGEGIGE